MDACRFQTELWFTASGLGYEAVDVFGRLVGSDDEVGEGDFRSGIELAGDDALCLFLAS